MCVELRRETEVINICAELRRGIGPTSEKITVVNRALPSLHAGSLEITLTVPLKICLLFSVLVLVLVLETTLVNIFKKEMQDASFSGH